MKIKLINVMTKVSLLFAVVLATAAVSAQAQSLSYRITADVPFDFSIADQKLPSGKYSVGRVRQNTNDMVLSIDDERGRSKAVRMSIPVRVFNAKDKATLVFHRYGDQYFLYQVWAAGDETGRQFPMSKTEREIRESLGWIGQGQRQGPAKFLR